MFWDIYCKLCAEINKKPNSVAKELGITSASVTKWKNGSIPRSPVLEKISKYFCVPVDYLLGKSVFRGNYFPNNNDLKFLKYDDDELDAAIEVYKALLKSFKKSQVEKLSSLSRDQADKVAELVEELLTHQ